MSTPSPAAEELDELTDYCSECGDYVGEGGQPCACEAEDEIDEYLESLEDPYLFEMSGEQEVLVTGQNLEPTATPKEKQDA